MSHGWLFMFSITDLPWAHRVIFLLPLGEPLLCGLAQHLVPPSWDASSSPSRLVGSTLAMRVTQALMLCD